MKKFKLTKKDDEQNILVLWIISETQFKPNHKHVYLIVSANIKDAFSESYKIDENDDNIMSDMLNKNGFFLTRYAIEEYI